MTTLNKNRFSQLTLIIFAGLLSLLAAASARAQDVSSNQSF